MKFVLKKSIARFVGAAVLASPLAVSAAEVDLLLLYDGDTESRFGGQPAATMRSWVDQVNTIYKNSGVDIQLRLVGALRNDPAGANMSEVLGNIRTNTWVRSKRDEYGADFVSQIHRLGSCGVGYMAVSSDWAYNVVGNSCGAVVLAHELGHNMGLNHSRRQGDTSGARYAYGLGHGVDGLFSTVMAYPSAFGTTRISLFSNPNLNCRGAPCGVPEGQPQQAYAVKALNNVRTELAAFRASKVPGGGGGGNGDTDTSTIVNNGVYTLKAKHSGLCADVAGSGTFDGANVLQWSCHGGNNQRWQFINLNNGYYEVKAMHSGKCLDVWFSGTANGTNIQTWSCNRTNAQQWKVDKNSDGSIRLTARVSGKVMDVSNVSTQNGANIHQWDYVGGANQHWTATRVQ